MHNGFDTLVGQLIYLRTFEASCITPEYIGWLQDSEVMRFSNQRFKTHTEESCRDYLDSFSRTSNIFCAIRMRDTDQIVGTITAYCSLPHGTADIGLMIGNRAVWGHGIGLDAWKTLMLHLLTEGGFRKVTGGTLRCNIGMVRIMERSGMHLEAVKAKQQILNGEAQDELYYARFRN